MAEKVYNIIMIILGVIAVLMIFAVVIAIHLPSRVDCSSIGINNGVNYAPTPIQCEGGTK